MAALAVRRSWISRDLMQTLAPAQLNSEHPNPKPRALRRFGATPVAVLRTPAVSSSCHIAAFRYRRDTLGTVVVGNRLDAETFWTETIRLEERSFFDTGSPPPYSFHLLDQFEIDGQLVNVVGRSVSNGARLDIVMHPFGKIGLE